MMDKMVSNFLSYIYLLCGYTSFRIVSGILYLFHVFQLIQALHGVQSLGEFVAFVG
jgi:hypothetical protein